MRRFVLLPASLLLLGAADFAEQGVALYRAGQWAAAAEAFRRSADAVATYDLGCALARAGDLSGALVAFEAALARDPSDADAAANRALMLRLLAAPPPSGEGHGHSGAAGTKVADRDVNAPPTPAESTGAQGMVGTRQSRSAAEATGIATVAPPRASAADAGRGEAAEARGSAAAGAGAIGAGRGIARETPAASQPVRLNATQLRERQQATRQWIATIPDDTAHFLRLRLLLEQARRQQAGTAVPPGGDPW